MMIPLGCDGGSHERYSEVELGRDNFTLVGLLGAMYDQ